MSDLEFRTIQRRERGAVLDLLDEWFGDRGFFARYFRYDRHFRDDLCFVAVDGGRIVSTLQVYRKTIRLNGKAVEVGGVGNVFTTAAYRERGVASQLLTRASAAMEEHGFDLSLLFAVRLIFYARLGWHSHVRHLIFVEKPPAPLAQTNPSKYAIKPFAKSDLAAVQRIYERYNADLSGPTIRDPGYWKGQLRLAGNPHEDFVTASDGGEIVAYARGTFLYQVYVVMEHGCLLGHDDAVAELICHLLTTVAAAFPGVTTQIAIAPSVQQALRDRGLTLRLVEDVFWMWRIISPQRLAAKLGLPESDLDTDDVFYRLLPPERSVYWIADRF